MLARVMRVDAVDRAGGREITIGEVIGAMRTKAGSQRRECGGPTARTKNQQIVRQGVKKSHLGERGALAEVEEEPRAIFGAGR